MGFDDSIFRMLTKIYQFKKIFLNKSNIKISRFTIKEFKTVLECRKTYFLDEINEELKYIEKSKATNLEFLQKQLEFGSNLLNFIKDDDYIIFKNKQNKHNQILAHDYYTHKNCNCNNSDTICRNNI